MPKQNEPKPDETPAAPSPTITIVEPETPTNRPYKTAPALIEARYTLRRACQ